MALLRFRHYPGSVSMRPAVLTYAAQVAQAVFVLTVGSVKGKVHRRLNGRDENPAYPLPR